MPDPTPAALPAAVPQNPIISWIRQPTTIQGIAVAVFAALGYALHYIAGPVAGSAEAGAAILIGIPDNTGFLHKIAAANPLLVSVPTKPAP